MALKYFSVNADYTYHMIHSNDLPVYCSDKASSAIVRIVFAAWKLALVFCTPQEEQLVSLIFGLG